MCSPDMAQELRQVEYTGPDCDQWSKLRNPVNVIVIPFTSAVALADRSNLLTILIPFSYYYTFQMHSVDGALPTSLHDLLKLDWTRRLARYLIGLVSIRINLLFFKPNWIKASWGLSINWYFLLFCLFSGEPT